VSGTDPPDVSAAFEARKRAYRGVIIGSLLLLVIFIATPLILMTQRLSGTTIILLLGAAIVPVAILILAMFRCNTCPHCASYMGSSPGPTCPSCGARIQPLRLKAPR
jgi:hypothetical protein